MNNFAMVFPGQGSQSIGMLAELSETYPSIKEVFAIASAALNYDLWQLIQQGPIEELNKTWKTQPALLAASYAIYSAWKAQGNPDPIIAAGHSLGEYSALTCAGVIDFVEAIKLVELRGKLMQEAVPEGNGAMYAIIGLDDDKIVQACQQAQLELNQVVSAVNFNSPGQVVIAGEKQAADRAGELCKEMGAKRALPLPVSVPSHCQLMKPAADKLANELNKIEFNSPKFTIINNVDVLAEVNPDNIKSALIKQLYSPVQWTKTIEYMGEKGINTVFEVGAGKVLTGLIKRIVPSINSIAINEPSSMLQAIQQIK